jgi:ubiquinone/menaquinone biosynthesis C-methylase UbiE
MLTQAKKKRGIKIVCLKSENLPFSNQCFNRVIMVDAFHHVCDQSETLSEMWRVLEPGGMLVIKEPDYTKVTVKFLAIIEKVLLMRSHFLTHIKIVERLNKILGNEVNAQVHVRSIAGYAWIFIKRNYLIR